MRVLGFSKKWPKLYQTEFTTFRFPRKDSSKGRDWKVGEIVQIVYHPRGTDREIICQARIIDKTQRSLTPCSIYWNPPIEEITEAEAVADGFESRKAMHDWMFKTYGGNDAIMKPINKLTLKKE